MTTHADPPIADIQGARVYVAGYRQARATLSAALVDLHTRDPSEPAPVCRECSRDWPCRTLRLLDPEVTP